MTAIAALSAIQQAALLPPWLDFFVATPIASAINGLILLLTIAALANLVIAWRQLGVEARAVDKLSDSLPDGEGVEQLTKDASFAATLAGQRVKIIRRATESLGTLELDLIAASDAEELHQAVAPSRAVAAGVVLLGLAGTLVGLSIGLVPLVEVFQTTEAAAPGVQGLWGAMSESVSGMRTAFSTTLTGVISAFLLGLGLKFYSRKQGTLLAKLERACLLVVVPSFTESRPQELSEVVESIDELRERFETSFSGLTEELEQRGASLSEEIVSGFDDATAEINRRFRQLVSPFEEIRDVTVRLMGSPDDDAESLAKQVARLEQASQALERSVKSAETLIPELRDTLLSTYSQQSEATRQALASHYRRVAEQVEEQSESTRELSEQVRRTAESVGTVAEDLSGFATAAEEYRRVWGDVASSVKAAEQTLDSRLASMGESVEKSVGRLVEEQANVQQRVLTSLTQFETQLTEAIEAVERERRRSVSRSEELIRELRDAVKDSIREVNARSEGQQEEVASALRKGLRELSNEIRDLLVPVSSRAATRQDGSGVRSRSNPAASGVEETASKGSEEASKTSIEQAFGHSESEAMDSQSDSEEREDR